MSCSAAFCSSRTTKGGVKDPDLSFHTFPKCPEIRSEWIKAVRRENWEPKKNSRLCSKHFDKSCFITGLSLKKLKSDALPTIFEGYPSYYKQVAKKRKTSQRRVVYTGISPEKRKKMEENGVKAEIPKTPGHAIKVLESLARSREVSSRRLKTIKKLRESNRRLENKNAELLNVINDLLSNNLIDDKSIYLFQIQ